MPHHDHLTPAGTLTVGAPAAVTLTIGAGPLRPPARRRIAYTPPSTAPLAVTHYQADDSVFFGEDYVIKGVPGRILWKLLREHVGHGRVRFSNRELRLDETLELPPGNDNLDSRLVSLRRRLARGHWGIDLLRVGRGRLQLRVEKPVALSEVPTAGPMRRPSTLAEPFAMAAAGDAR